MHITYNTYFWIEMYPCFMIVATPTVAAAVAAEAAVAAAAAHNSEKQEQPAQHDFVLLDLPANRWVIIPGWEVR